MKIAVVIPSRDMVHTDFAMSLTRMMMQPPVQCALINIKSASIPGARFQGVKAAMKIEASHILFIDSDMTFPATLMEDLIRHKKDVVGVTYYRREPPITLVGRKEKIEPFVDADLNTGLIPAYELGFGAILINMQLFYESAPPWFLTTYEEGSGWTSEDEHFCHNHKVWCDTDLSTKMGHIGAITR